MKRRLIGRALAAALVGCTAMLIGCAREEAPVAQAETALEGAGLMDVEVEWHEQENALRLSGVVGHESERMRAEEVVSGAVGTTGRIVNEIEVREEEVFGSTETITGCLTAGPADQLVLTARPTPLTSGMATATGEAVPTYSYELVSDRDQDLRAYAGQQVEVTGRVQEEPNTEVELEAEHQTETDVERAPAAEPEPKVDVEQEIEIVSRKLLVESVQPLGTGCSE